MGSRENWRSSGGEFRRASDSVLKGRRDGVAAGGRREVTRPNREVNILIQDRGEWLERCPRVESLTLQEPEHLMHRNKRTDCVHRCSWREGCLSKSSLSLFVFLTCEIYLPKST